jgi:hypothetical protein
MGELINNLPDIIRQAAQNTLGIAALMIIAFTILAYLFFAREHRRGRKRGNDVTIKTVIFVMLFFGCFLFAVVMTQHNQSRLPFPLKPGIEIRMTIIPPSDPGGDNSWGDIAGQIEGLDNPLGYTNCAVAVYSYTDRWYVEPDDIVPLTEIGQNGDWSRKIHLGFRYTVILVKKPFLPPNKFDSPYIPLRGTFLAMTNFEGIK